MKKYCCVDLEHYSYVSLIKLNFFCNQHLIDFPAFFKLTPDSKAINNCCKYWKIWLYPFFLHLLQYFICHFRGIVFYICLHEGSIEKLAVSKP
jgi:hypothetical protein